MQNKENVQQAVAFVSKNVSLDEKPCIGLVLGTGLDSLCTVFEQHAALHYEQIPGFPASTVQSHAGKLSCGSLQGVPVWLLQGRFHLYEGYSPAEVCMGVRTLALLGVKTLIMTNAAGALNPLFPAGGLMCISDHINFTGENPLVGTNVDEWGPRFPDMCRLYAHQLRNLARQAALDAGVPLEQGVYLGLRGPCLETPAETRAFRRLGADAVGMSTVLEAVAARHMGLELLGISCLTNKNLPDCMQPTSLEEVIATARQSSHELGRLLCKVITRLAAQTGT